MEKGLKNLLASLLVVTLFISCKKDEKDSADPTEIQKIIQEEVTSWNKGDAKAYSVHFAEEGTFTNILGMFSVGHQKFLEQHAKIFQTVFSNTKLIQEVVSLKFIQPDIAIVETISWVSGFSNGPMPGTSLDDKGRLRVRLLQVMVKDGGEWKIVAYHNVDIKSGIPAPEPH